jgi:presequence protease
MKPNDQLHGFTVKAVTPVPSLRMTAIELLHEKSGARMLHLKTEDSENLVSISFRTPPPDDTGLPHIMEHSVLAGSKRFPVRDPFFEMLKMSMATFLNAMTGSDITYYPVASNVKQDLFNLAEVYFDAVFHPLISENTFKREGHHLAPVDPEKVTGDLTVSGIVFNEMKGAFSNPEARLYRSAMQALLPETAHGRESGGDPDVIPDLTFEQFNEFYATYYHPSNAFLIMYGDIPTEEYAEFADERLRDFDSIDIAPDLRRQPRWSEARNLEDVYPIGADEPDEAKTFLLCDWLVGDALDPVESVLWQVLGQYLLGNEAAPLKKAIIDSQLGEDLIYAGYMDIGLEATFHVGIKGSEADRGEAFRALVEKTLSDLADSPIDREAVEAAFRQTVYRYQEIDSHFPLHAMDWVVDSWLHDGDPLAFLHMADHLKAAQAQFEADGELFNKMIRTHLIENTHRLAVTLTPDREWQARSDAKFAERMKETRASLTDEDMVQIANSAAAIQLEAGTPNSAEDLAKLPQLKVADLPAKPREIAMTVEDLAGATLLVNDVFANGVNYLEIDFNLQGMPKELWAYLPRYTDALRRMGADGMNYEAVARRMAASTGGIGCRTYLDTNVSDPDQSVVGLRIGLKALDAQVPDALDLLSKLLFSLDPRDAARLEDLLIQSRAHCRTSFIHRGTPTAIRHASRGLNPETHLDQIISGLPQLELAETLAARFDAVGGEVMDRIEAIRDFLLNRNRVTISFTGSADAADSVRGALGAWLGKMSDEPLAETDTGFVLSDTSTREGLAAPIQIAHCAKVYPAPHTSNADEPLIALGAHLTTFDYMLSEIRLKGNAYGAFCRYDSLGRNLNLGSFRDPHVLRTLKVMDDVGGYVCGADWTQEDIDRAIIGKAKDDEHPIRPEDATATSLRRHLIGLTPELRQQRADRMRAATPAEVKRAFLAVLQENDAQAAVCVLAGRDKLEAANKTLGDKALAIEDIIK